MSLKKPIKIAERLPDLEGSRVQDMGNQIRSRSRIFSHLSATVLALLFVFSISQFELESLKGMLLDGLFRTKVQSMAHPSIKLIGYNEKSATRYGLQSGIPVEELIQLFDALAVEKPLAVAFIGPLNKHTYSQEELHRLAQSMAKLDHVFIGYTDDESLGTNPPLEIAPVAKYLPGFVSRDTFSYGSDSVSRRVMISIQNVPTVFTELAHLYFGGNHEREFKHAHQLGTHGDSNQAFVHWQGPPGTYPVVSSRDFLEKRVNQSDYRNKIVLIGRSLKRKYAEDFVFSPFSRQPVDTPVLEAAAHGLGSLLNDNSLYKTPSWLNALVSLLIGVLTVNMVLFLPPFKGILFVGAELLFVTFAAWVGLQWFDLWIDLAHPLVVACVGYYLVIPYRLVDEYRKRWHYQEKTEIMVQLEQLKSNFLSLISHDLKTPIAQIQGKAELLLNENNPLNTKQKDSLHAIVQTTDHLSKYVETVLDLTRVESSKIPLTKTTKDINAVINEVIDSKMALAAEKDIVLTASLEPMFSFKFDVRLMKRVIGNLVENAIKYSPEGSTITLISHEEGEWVHVSVEDQGMGIATEEQDKIFDKFYRCEKDETSQIKGTGLGLYLVRYFVELHSGAIKLKSEMGKGSVFTVSLPV